jgi:hypothetical protein
MKTLRDLFGGLVIILQLILGALVVWGVLAFVTWVMPVVETGVVLALFLAMVLGVIAVLIGAAWAVVRVTKLYLIQRERLAERQVDLDAHAIAEWTTPLKWWPLIAVMCALSVLALLVAILPISEYAYYIGLRWLVFLTAIGLGWVWMRVSQAGICRDTDPTLPLVVVIVLWNPLVPVQLWKVVWMPLDYIAALVLLSAGIRLDGVISSLRRASQGFVSIT